MSIGLLANMVDECLLSAGKLCAVSCSTRELNNGFHGMSDSRRDRRFMFSFWNTVHHFEYC